MEYKQGTLRLFSKSALLIGLCKFNTKLFRTNVQYIVCCAQPGNNTGQAGKFGQSAGECHPGLVQNGIQAGHRGNICRK